MTCSRCGTKLSAGLWANQRLLVVLLPGNEQTIVCGRCHRAGEAIVEVLKA